MCFNVVLLMKSLVCMTQGIALRKYSSTEHTTLGVATSYPKMLVVCSSWTVRLDLQVQQIPFELGLNLLNGIKA